LIKRRKIKREEKVKRKINRENTSFFMRENSNSAKTEKKKKSERRK